MDGTSLEEESGGVNTGCDRDDGLLRFDFESGGPVKRLWAFVSTPFQAIGVAELANHKRREVHPQSIESTLFIISNAKGVAPMQMASIAEGCALKWKIVQAPRYLPRRVASIYYLIRCRVLIRELRFDDIVAVGYAAHDLFKDILGRARCKELWGVDDGIATASMLEDLCKRGSPLPTVRTKSHVYYKVVPKLLNVREPDWNRLRWYTIFYPEYRHMSSVYPNKFDLIRARIMAGRTVNEVWFMGSPLVSVGIVNPDTFETWMRIIATQLKEQYTRCRLIYRQHTGECNSELKEGVGYQFFDEVRESTGPVEWIVAHGKNVPTAVSSVLSTSIVTMRQLLPPSIPVILWRPDLTSVEPRHRNHIEAVIEFLERASLHRNIDVREIRTGWPFE